DSCAVEYPPGPRPLTTAPRAARASAAFNGAATPCRWATRTISPLRKSVSASPVLRLSDCQAELLGPPSQPGTGRTVGPSTRAAVDVSKETKSIPACPNTCSPSLRSAATNSPALAGSATRAPTALPRLLSSLLYFHGATSGGVRTRIPAAFHVVASPANRSASACVPIAAGHRAM